ncbi:hypothetical protein [Mesorhizobium sp.]|uniref:hypothetical protein n=1 Tax=Mesorhizobium sp. TaxID=1871066 RepID=UPI000FE54BC8|nr:hypothetical protein [Mesorhizobium sp.]RWC31485.1 MAG: hypothetical protein EOS27_09885 [Mesorhizobium sp.]RWC61184.1 MAG: hypothetical protein EOS56_11990 [Mesorhizobium sp.]RWC65368.1 MAG: hypothetical protein EOS29_09065 [Mesorhizobium sp.]TIX27480.1 MAG: hypothetical protein E5V35_06155 [Mesorhizobium sp.]
MVKSTPLQDDLLSRLGTFRPSDRERFRQAFQSPNEERDAHRAIERFVEGWEDGRWVESYSIERIGKWLAVNAPEKMIKDLSKWTNSRQTLARGALKKGFLTGRHLSNDERLLIS